MRQEHLRHSGGIDRQPGETSHQASAAVEQQRLRAGRHQGADAQSLRIGNRTAGMISVLVGIVNALP